MALRVSILCQNYEPETTGNAPYTASLAQALAERGHAVTVHTTYPYYPDWTRPPAGSRWTESTRGPGLTVTRRRQFVPRRPSALPRLLSELSFGLRLLRVRPEAQDIVVLASPSLFASALASIRLRFSTKRPRRVLWVQDLYSRGVLEIGLGGAATARAMRAVESKVMRSADAVVAIHESFASYIEHTLDVDPQRIATIRNWSHLPEPPVVDVPRTRLRFGWSPDETVVLHAGNQGAKQGLEQLVDIGRSIDQQDLPIRIVLLGGGHQNSRLRDLCSDVRSIQFLAALPSSEFQAAMASADVLLVCERGGLREMSVPSKLTSYFSTGKPVLAISERDSAASTELELSGAGIRVDPGDVTGALRAIQHVASSPEKASAMGAAGRAYRRRRLTPEAAVRQFEELFVALQD